MSVNVSLVETGIEEARSRYRLMSESFVAAPKVAAKAGSDILLEMLKRFAPERTHRLKTELGFELSRLGSGFVARFYGPFYVKWVLEGRGPVWAGIYTGKSDKKYLHFWIDGKEIFTTHVKAARANDFRVPALAAARPGMELLMHEIGVRTIRGQLAETTIWG